MGKVVETVVKKKFKKLRRKSFAPSVILFLISIIFGILVVFITASVLAGYIGEIKYLDKVNSMYSLMGEASERIEGGESIEAVFNEIWQRGNKPLAISVFDADKQLVVSYGEEANIEYLETTGDDVSIDVFVPQENEADPIEVKSITYDLDLQELLERFFKEFPNCTQSEQKLLDNLYIEVYRFDFWLSGKLLQGQAAEKTVYIKYYAYYSVNDCIVILLGSVMSFIMFMIILIVGLCILIHNVKSQRYILKLLMRDHTTGAANGLAFEEFATKRIAARRNLKKAYGIVDFSMMKYQNYCTLYGTHEGEKLLMALNEVINKYLQKGEIVAKYNGADFCLLLKPTHKDETQEMLIQRIQDMIAGIPEELNQYTKKKKIEIDGIENLRFQVGLYYLMPATSVEQKEKRKKKNLDVGQLQIKAAMAKQGLGEEAGFVVYNHKMWEKELWEKKVEDMMQAALDGEEFQVYVQPKYHPSTEKLSGGEALVRWISPTEGFISPGQFIPIFEKNGFITKLDDYMISHTAQLQAKWLSEGKEIVPISVNVSRAHFAQPDLAEHIAALVDQYSLPHKYIEIELTESAFFDDKKALLHTVGRLQELEFEVSMDDFGSGYSSLNSLKDLPLNVLKLDAEFFRGEDFDQRGEIVVSEAIALAKLLNMRIVAEGVEKKEQVDFLASLDCDMIQGFYFAKPMPASEYELRMQSAESGPKDASDEDN